MVAVLNSLKKETFIITEFYCYSDSHIVLACILYKDKELKCFVKIVSTLYVKILIFVSGFM